MRPRRTTQNSKFKTQNCAHGASQNSKFKTQNSRMDLYHKLQSSPLFQGLSSDNLMQIIGQTKFIFHKYAPGDIIKQEGEPYKEITLLIDGTVNITSWADDHGYSIEEVANAPYTIQLERLFGLTQHSAATITAATTCHTVAIDKNSIMHISDEFIIFRINLLNIISTTAQRQGRNMWHPCPTNTQKRIAQFIKTRCTLPYGPKTIRIKMTRMATEIGTSRTEVSKALNTMKASKLLHFSRGIITISKIQLL